MHIKLHVLHSSGIQCEPCVVLNLVQCVLLGTTRWRKPCTSLPANESRVARRPWQMLDEGGALLKKQFGA